MHVPGARRLILFIPIGKAGMLRNGGDMAGSPAVPFIKGNDEVRLLPKALAPIKAMLKGV